jgi:hypothetical protein
VKNTRPRKPSKKQLLAIGDHAGKPWAEGIPPRCCARFSTE